MTRQRLVTYLWFIAVSFTASGASAALNAVNVHPDGITFPDNTVQKSAVVLPSCTSGEVYLNSGGTLVCGKIIPIERGIAACISGVCSVSGCMTGYGDCDHTAGTGCETDLLTSTRNCGACGVTCTAAQACEAGTCKNLLACGDGIVSAGEQCDDGNTTNGDGCSAACSIELGYNCFGSPSVCAQAAVCGDGIVSSGEQCDDGNVTGSDGCSSVCLTEPGYSCVGSPSVCSPIPAIDFCRVVWPTAITTQPGSATDVYGSVYINGVTVLPAPSASIIAQVGYGPAVSNPSTNLTGWLWTAASYLGANGSDPNSDEYKGTVTAPAAGTYGYVYRFRYDSGPWVYCDLDGTSQNGINPITTGQIPILTVAP